MPLFAELAQMLDKPGKAIVMNVVAIEGGRLAVTVVPKGDWKERALGAGLSVQAGADELDAGLIEQLRRYAATHKSLAEQVDSTIQVMQAAEQASREKAQAAIKKVPPPKATAPATSSPAANAPAKAESSTPAGPAKARQEGEKETIDLF